MNQPDSLPLARGRPPPPCACLVSQRQSGASLVPACAIDRPELGEETIRSVLLSALRTKTEAEPSSLIVEELGLCRGTVRADIAVVNGLLHGYEIKSDRDSLRRLAHQTTMYGRVFDRATLVVGHRFERCAPSLVPPWWGIRTVRCVEETLTIITIRHSLPNPSRDPRALVELLWYDQALALLEELGAARGVRGKPRADLWDRICHLCDIEEIADAVRANLRARPIRPESGKCDESSRAVSTPLENQD